MLAAISGLRIVEATVEVEAAAGLVGTTFNNAGLVGTTFNNTIIRLVVAEVPIAVVVAVADVAAVLVAGAGEGMIAPRLEVWLPSWIPDPAFNRMVLGAGEVVEVNHGALPLT